MGPRPHPLIPPDCHRAVSFRSGSPGEGAIGLERPTFVERVIAAIPLPYLVTCTIVALLVTGPGYFLARLIETGGERNTTHAAGFGNHITVPPPRSDPPHNLSFGLAFLLLCFLPPFPPLLPPSLPAQTPPPPPR